MNTKAAPMDSQTVTLVQERPPRSGSWRNWAIGLIFAAGVILRLVLPWHPADDRMLNGWRESDYSQIARNFDREGMNILFPRVDWRGDTPGYVEMEFPFIPWLTAAAYRVFGYHEIFLRLISSACSIGALFAFWVLARKLLSRDAAIIGLGLFAANGLLFALSGAIQPEALLILVTTIAGIAIVRWRNTGDPRDLFIASLWVAAAILVKAPAAHLGLLIAWFALQKYGVKAAVTPSVLAGAALALAPAVLWYAWAHHLYSQTGLSLGLSNETHFLSPVMLRHPADWLANLASLERREVFGYAGVIPAAVAFFSRRCWRNGLAPWYASVVIFYVATADTSADNWAYYYHALSIVPASLLMADGLERIAGFAKRLPRPWSSGAARSLLVLGFAVLIAALSLRHGMQIISAAYHQPRLARMYRELRTLAPRVPRTDRIIVRGGTRQDPHGHPVAYNESMAFLWMDRKGFNYAQEDFTLPVLLGLRDRGARYWIAQPEDREDSATFAAARSVMTPVDTTGAYQVFRLPTP